MFGRLLVPSSALLWGLQFAFLSPALALILVNLYGATTSQVGWVLAVYNAGGFVVALVLPAWADRRNNYLLPMLGCGVLTLLLAAALALATSLPWATVALVVLGGPAGVGLSMLFAQMRHSGARPAQIVNTRAVTSVAWVAGPPVATLIIAQFGPSSILLAVAVVAAANIATSGLMMRQARAQASSVDQPAQPAVDDALPVGHVGMAIITAAFVLFQATNATAMSILAVYVPQTMGLDVVWAGIALGVAAGLEVPALVIVGRLTTRFSSLGLVMTSAIAGIAYYLGLAAINGPVGLIALQILNAWCFAGIGGVGLTLFQQIIHRPGLATGLYMNTRRVGAVVSGPLIALGSVTALGQRGIFLASALLTALGLIMIVIAGRANASRPAQPVPLQR